MIKQYPSIMALRADYLANPPPYVSRVNDAWFGGETAAQTIKLSEIGDTRLVPAAEAMLEQLDTTIDTPRRAWTRSPVGAWACVPDVIAGLPTPMRRMVDEPDDRAPINIFVVTTSSAGISAKAMADRGVAVLALVLALSRVRPVNLHQVDFSDGNRDGTGETIFTAQINTTPLDLATACYALTSAGFTRRMCYGLARSLNDFSGGWPRGYSVYNKDIARAYEDNLVLRLGLDPTKTLMIGASRLFDLKLADMREWVQDQINHFTGQTSEEPS